MNVVILAAGEASRMGGIEKALLRVGDRFLIQYSVDNAILLEPHSINIVVRPVSKIPEALRRTYQGTQLNFIVQDRPLGTMDAIRRVYEVVSELPYFLMLSDEVLIRPRIKEMVQEYSYCDGIVGYVNVTDTEEVRKTYSVETYNNLVYRLIEKPREVYSLKKGTGYCIIGRKLLENMFSSREANFVEAIDASVRKSCIVKAFNVCDRYFNVNTWQDYSEVLKYSGGK